jgi:hypothetical protein
MPEQSISETIPGVAITFDPGPEKWTIDSGVKVSSQLSSTVISTTNQSTLDNFGYLYAENGAVNFDHGSSGAFIINEKGGYMSGNTFGIRFDGNGMTIENFGNCALAISASTATPTITIHRSYTTTSTASSTTTTTATFLADALTSPPSPAIRTSAPATSSSWRDRCGRIGGVVAHDRSLHLRRATRALRRGLASPAASPSELQRGRRTASRHTSGGTGD